MRYRKLSPTGDYVFGGNLTNFYINQAEAVGQAVLTRLNLNLGEWFMDTSAGTPWQTKVLGTHTQGSRDSVIQSRILGTPGVLQLTQYISAVDPKTRTFAASVTISTIYGSTTVTTSL
jgi:hypothetical protein